MKPVITTSRTSNGRIFHTAQNFFSGDEWFTNRGRIIRLIVSPDTFGVATDRTLAIGERLIFKVIPGADWNDRIFKFFQDFELRPKKQTPKKAALDRLIANTRVLFSSLSRRPKNTPEPKATPIGAVVIPFKRK